LQTLGLVDRQDPMTEMVATKLVELATSGIRDPDRLKALTIQAFTQQQQQQQQIQRKLGWPALSPIERWPRPEIEARPSPSSGVVSERL
jgi:hypothetical protein